MTHSILRHVAEKTKTPIIELYESIGWPLNKKYGHSVDAFKLSITNPDVWQEVTFKNDVVKNELQSILFTRIYERSAYILVSRNLSVNMRSLFGLRWMRSDVVLTLCVSSMLTDISMVIEDEKCERIIRKHRWLQPHHLDIPSVCQDNQFLWESAVSGMEVGRRSRARRACQ